MSDDIIAGNRIYKCLGCGIICNERAALDHQVKCDNAMEQIKPGTDATEFLRPDGTWR